ncbi:MAG: T9SS type A sorting domain-containing protein [Flavobacteriaceae bacterium]|nr:T9SS type A sorting domain-containing protein [Flavobacteriaceae bacterium]
MEKYLILFLVFTSSNLFAQEITQKFNFPNQLSENSGLIYFDGKIIAHNDSGGKSILYEVDALTGKIVREVAITNAINIDWEDIAQDKEYIYISDSGNNLGNRTNLKIYKVSKKDFLNSSNITAQIINYNYSDQEDFRYSSKSNFDAEALIVYYDKLLIFSKNKGDNKTNVYSLPKTIGTHIAEKINTIDVGGQITGASYNHKANSIVLCGYSLLLSPFIIFLDDFDIKSKSFIKIDLSEYIGAMSQVEGVSYGVNDEILISRERFRKKIAGFSIDIPSGVFVLNKEEWNISPKVISNYINDFSIASPSEKFKQDVLKITNALGETIFSRKDTIKSSDIDSLKKGVYYARIKLNNQIIINQRLIKK